MARKERISKGRTMLPNFFVFCEGDTEVAYVDMLRSHYRLPLHIIAKRTLLNITSALVERCKSAYVQTKSDQTFLMYDLDVPTMLQKLQMISGTTMLCSNPCFELWLLLHYSDQKTGLSSVECVNRLSSFVKHYKKGILWLTDKQYLISNTVVAASRAKALQAFNNPSSTVHLLLEALDSMKQRQASRAGKTLTSKA